MRGGELRLREQGGMAGEVSVAKYPRKSGMRSKWKKQRQGKNTKCVQRMEIQ